MSVDQIEISLSEVCELVTDGTHDSPKLKPSGVPFIKGKHISSGVIDFENCDFISEEDHRLCIKRVEPQAGDILMSNIGSVGDSAQVPHGYTFSIKNVALLRPNRSIVNELYFFYLFRNPAFKKKLINLKAGSAQQYISLAALRGHRITIVKHLPTQERIAGVLSAYDDLIENNRRRIALLEQAARLLYREWFVHFRFPGSETTKFVDGLPEGWEVRKVKDLITRLKSKPKVRKDEYQAYGQWPCVDQGQDFIGGYTDNREAIYHDGLPLIVFGDHTRALKFVDFPFARGADGTQIIQSNEERLPQELFYFSLINVDLSNYAYARHFKFLKEQEIIVPTLEMAKIFSDQAKAIFDQVRTLRGQNQKLTEARDLLLPRLMDGRLPIPE
ncbi:restriction endonuclease subunit S [Thalassovita sp.]|uniref:restriction endonuclease subunit S n=1 Tax=Thalassovita sp. TaxID=1979401 RepID=UPI002B264E7F|nr:restriction endonuclease subunit S [Thalassovita sp.]